MYDRQRLIELFRQHALKFGDFTLASGKKSTYYLDGRLITLHAEGLKLIAEGILETLGDLEFAAVGGMSIGADPIVGGVLPVAAQHGRPLLGFIVRKEAKEHGTKRLVEGPVPAGSQSRRRGRRDYDRRPARCRRSTACKKWAARSFAPSASATACREEPRPSPPAAFRFASLLKITRLRNQGERLDMTATAG